MSIDYSGLFKDWRGRVDRFDNMRVFAKVVESGSFTGAAARLGMSVSRVSQHVKELEERLAARLLNRTTRKVPYGRRGRAELSRGAGQAADARRSLGPQLPYSGWDWVIPLPRVASDGGRRHRDEHLAEGKPAQQQRGGAHSRGARRTRFGVPADLFRRRCAAVGGAGGGARLVHLAAAKVPGA